MTPLERTEATLDEWFGNDTAAKNQYRPLLLILINKDRKEQLPKDKAWIGELAWFVLACCGFYQLHWIATYLLWIYTLMDFMRKSGG